MSFVNLDELPRTRPTSVNDLCELVRGAAANGQAIYPRGGRTMLDFGLPPMKPGIAIDLTALDQVIDYPARDMTLTVQAGITIARLQEILAKENQRLPIDVPLPEWMTLGGALACNVSGPRRYGYGTFRDYVIGISVVNDRGQETKAGGRVVKNVAGYDLCKLHIGALGTLGIITQVTLKVLPKPEESTLAMIDCQRAEDLSLLLERLHGAKTRPVSMTVKTKLVSVKHASLGPDPTSTEGWRVVVGFEDNRAAVAWQIDQLQKELASEWPTRYIPSDGGAEPIWQGLAAFPALAGGLTFKANVLPSTTAEFCRQALTLVGKDPILQAEAGNGIVIGHLLGDRTLEQAKGVIAALRNQAIQAYGNLILTRCPDEWKAELGVWGAPRGDWDLMRRIKRQLDPQNLFNPGRFVGGI